MTVGINATLALFCALGWINYAAVWYKARAADKLIEAQRRMIEAQRDAVALGDEAFAMLRRLQP